MRTTYYSRETTGDSTPFKNTKSPIFITADRATARNGESRGLLQLRPAAWTAVSMQPYEPTVWDWRANLDMGIDYLAFCRSELQRRSDVEFSYPLLLAAFHYGLEHVEARQFDLRRLKCPDNEIYRRLWEGGLAPLAPPR